MALAGLLPLAFLGVFFGWPVAAIVARGFVTDGALDLSGFTEVLARGRTWEVVGRTLAQASVGTALAVLLGVPGAYVLYRCSFPGRGAVRAFVTVPFVLPTVVVGVAFRGMLVEGGPLGFLGLDGTFTAVVAALVFFNYCVVVRTVGALWSRLDPRAEQAARALGAAPWRAFWSVTLPSLGPAIASAASIVFLFCATAFGTVLVLGGPGYGTVETEIYQQTVTFLDLRTAAVLSMLQLLVVSGCLLAAAVSRRRRESALQLQNDSTVDRRLCRGDLPAVAVTVVVVLGLLVAPLVSLVIGSLRTAEGWGWDNYANLSTTGSRDALEATVWEAAANSTRIAVDATVIAVTVGVLICIVCSRRPRRPAARRALSAFDALFMLPLGVSAVTVGFGFLITLNRPPLDLRSSVVLIPIAQAVVAIPLVIRTLLPVLRAIDQGQREVAGVLGAAPARVFAAVDLPVLGRSLGLAVGFAFAVSLGEFGATSFLSQPERPTLPVVIVRLIGRPGADNLGMALAASVVLAATTMMVMGLAERFRVQTTGADL
ncbi:MAG: iron ABC transporter permease [Actinomycetota bacterium]|nr:iron ABC transporter permease [Actinomycetota bacterium]